MEFSKLKSNSQRSLRSLFFLTKESTLVNNHKQLLIASLNNFIKYLESFIFNWNLFFFSIKKTYLFQIMTFNEINTFNKNFIFLFVKKIKNSRNTILLFFNIPFIISIIISELFESIIKKTIYLYRFFLVLSIPVLIFSVNQTFISPTKKDYLSFLLPEQKKNFSLQDQQNEKNSLYLQNLKKKIIHKYILNILPNKIKSLQLAKQDFFCFFEKSFFVANVYERMPLWISFPFKVIKGEKKNQFFIYNKIFSFNLLKVENKIQMPVETTQYTDQKANFFSKWFYLYIKLKKNYLVNLSFWTPLNLKVIKGEQNNCRFQFLDTQGAKNKFFKKEFLQNIDSYFFSLVQPKDLLHLRNLPVKILSYRHSFTLDILDLKRDSLRTPIILPEEPQKVPVAAASGKNFNKESFFVEKNINWYEQRKSNKNVNLLQNINNRQWMVTIKQWINFYLSHEKVSCFSRNKQKVKESFQKFHSVKFFIPFFKNCFSFWTFFGQIYIENSVLNRANLSSIFITCQQPFVFRSYKNALTLPFQSLKRINSKLPTIPEEVLKKNYLIKYFPIVSTNNKKLSPQIKVIGYLNFQKDSIFLNPESFFLIKNKSENWFPNEQENNVQLNKSEFSSSSIGTILYDLDYYLKNNKSNNEFFWIPISSLHKNILEQEKNKLNQKKFFSSSIQTTKLSKEDFKIIKKKRENLHETIQSTQLTFFKKYKKWIFTSQWWLFYKQGIFTEIQSFGEYFTTSKKIFLKSISKKIGSAKKKYFLFAQNLIIIPNSFIGQGWNKVFVEKIDMSQQQKSFWVKTNLITLVTNRSWSFFAWFITSSMVYYHWVPMFIGIIYLFMWLDFEKIRSFSYPSWKTFLTILTHNSLESPSQQLRLVRYLSKGRMFSLYSKFARLYSEIFFIFNKLNYITTLDLSRRNKNLVSNSLITKKTLQSQYYFWNTYKETPDNFGKKNKNINGFTFFKKWYEKNCRISTFLQKIFFKSFSLNWLNDLFFYNKILLNSLTIHSNKISSKWESKPIPLSEPLQYTQRWLFIGSLESGKSFIIKNIAASTHYPLIHISIKDIKNSTPDSKYNKIRKQKRWVEQLSDRSFFLDNIFNLAKMMAPSLFWIADLHEFDTKNQIQEKNTQNFDFSLLMAALLKILSVDLVPEGQNHITFIGSTDYPRLLDPKIVSRQRLDLIINFRTPSFQQRQSIFTFLLQTKGFTIKELRSFYELKSNTLGYTFRDITSLVNETLLVKTTENTTFIDSNTIRLALYRQTSTQSVKDKTLKHENLQYKIGKALVQTILVHPKSIILLNKYHDLWKTKFYYLSNIYLEVSSQKSITTEFVLLTQILNCLSGAAARDARILTKNVSSFQNPKGQTSLKGKKIVLSLTSQLKHDFSIASNILQSLLMEFSMRDITCLSPQKKKTRKDILKTFYFKFLKRAMSYLEFLDQFPRYINWSIKGKRLSFNWILFFNGIEHSTKNLARLLFLDKSKKNIFDPVLLKNIDINSPYERRENKQQQQKIQKIDSFFNKMVYSMYMENLGFPWESNYVMDYNPFQFSLFFREARPLWNPQTIMPSYSILFFNRDLLINQKMLTKIYITYGNKFKIEKLNRKRIKKQIFWSNSFFNNQGDQKDVNNIFEIKNEVEKNQTHPHETHWADFCFYQNMINLNAQLDQSQIELPFYFHQGWITADPNDIYQNFDFFSTKILVNNDHLIYKESFLFEILLEIYHYLLKFFIKNKHILIQIEEKLLKNEIVYRQDIEFIMKKYF